MSLLDRLLSRPKWQNADPAVRAHAVREMGHDQADVLQRLARTDPEAQVRRAALKKLGDASLLVEAARQDESESVRQDALDMLVELAQGADETAARTALDALSEPRHVTAVAREGRIDEVRRQALSRITDERLIASVARSGIEPSIRAAAAERITEPALVAELALKSEHKEVALPLVERLADVDALDAVAQRGRQKQAVKRARARVSALRPAAPPPPPDTTPQRLTLCRSLESIAGATELTDAAERLAGAIASWDELPGEPDPEVLTRWQTATAAVRRRLEQRDAEAEQARQATSAQEREAALRRSLVSRVEALAGSEIPAGLDAAGAEWEALGAPIDPSMATAFEQAVAGARLRHEEYESNREQHEKLAALAAEAEALAGSAEGRRFTEVRRDWQALARKVAPEPEVQARFEAALATLTSRADEARRKRSEEARERLSAVEEKLAGIEAVAAGETLSLKDGDRALKEIRAALDDRGALPTPADRERIVARLKEARAKIFPRMQEMREADEWKRWGNATAREEIISRMEALATLEDLPKLDAQFRELQAAWSKAAEVPRADFEPLRQRWQAARDPVWQRIETWRKERHEQFAASLEKKKSLVERAEALADSTAWVTTAQEIQKLQQEWKESGPAPRKDGQALWERFRAATGKFFERRKQDLSQKKGEWSSNLQKKEALLARAEELAQSSDWDQAAAELKKLQTEWKEIGPVQRSKSDEIWKRFRAAADTFFSRYKRRDELAAEEQQQDRDRMAREMESLADALAPAGADHVPPAPADLALRVQDVLERWSRLPAPGGRRRPDAIAERLFAARDRLIDAHREAFAGTELDPANNLERMEKLCARVEELALTVQRAAVPPEEMDGETLARRLRESLAARTMGAPSEEEARWNTAREQVEAAQAEWRRVGPTPGAEGQALAQRFKAACDRVAAARPK